MRLSNCILILSLTLFSFQSNANIVDRVVGFVRDIFSGHNYDFQSNDTITGRYYQVADAEVIQIKRYNIGDEPTWLVRSNTGRWETYPISDTPRGGLPRPGVVVQGPWTKSSRNVKFIYNVRQDNSKGGFRLSRSEVIDCRTNWDGHLNGKGCMNPNVNQGRPLGNFSNSDNN